MAVRSDYLSSGGGGGSVKLTAANDITSGDPVYVDNDGKARKYDLDLNHSFLPRAYAYDQHFVRIPHASGGLNVIAFYDGGSSNYGKLIYYTDAEFKNYTENPSFTNYNLGTVVTFNAGTTYDISMKYVPHLDKLIIYYRDGSNGNYGTIIPIGWDGSSITIGSEFVINSTTSYEAFILDEAIPGYENYLFIASRNNSNLIYLKRIDFTGGVPSTIETSATSIYGYNPFFLTISNGHCVIGSVYSNNSRMKSFLPSLVGGNENTWYFNNTNGPFGYAYNEASNTALYDPVNGFGVVLGSGNQWGVARGGLHIGVVEYSSNSLASWETTLISHDLGRIVSATRNVDNTFTVLTGIGTASYRSGNFAITFSVNSDKTINIISQNFLIAGAGGNNNVYIPPASNYGMLQIVGYDSMAVLGISSDTDHFSFIGNPPLGVAEKTTSVDGEVTVLRGGNIVDTYSGLTPGREYYVMNCKGQKLGLHPTFASPKPVGKAISDTELLIY
jgi:hypothetical protein